MNRNLFQWNEMLLCTWLVCRAGVFIRHHGLSWQRPQRAGPQWKKRAKWLQWDKRNSPDLHGPFFFSQFISSWIARLSHTSEEGEDHTRASVTLCFTNEACTLRLLAFAFLPFETAAAWCYNTLVVLLLLIPSSRLLSCLCVTWLCLSSLRLFKAQIATDLTQIHWPVCSVSVTFWILTWAQRDTLKGRWCFNKF